MLHLQNQTQKHHVLCMCALGRVGLFATPWTVACQAPLAYGIFQARILEWVAISTPRDIPNQGLNPRTLHLLHW